MTIVDWGILLFVIWFLFLRNIRIIKIDSPIEKIQRERMGGEKIEEEMLNAELPPIICNTEFIENQIYVWNKHTSEFLIQGKTMEDIVNFFTEKHPGRKIILVEKKEA